MNSDFPSIPATTGNRMPWVCCQIGAREHYSIPRALDAAGLLECLITDSWLTPRHPLRLGPWKRLKQRFHSALISARVKAWPCEAAWLNAVAWRSVSGWDRIFKQNDWFGRKAAAFLEKFPEVASKPRVVFSYSYTAVPVFEWAKAHGWTTVLGQIDCGLPESLLVQKLTESYTGRASNRPTIPDFYWKSWRRELALADKIIVNSGWSRENLLLEGVPESKIKVIPLAYDPPQEAVGWIRSYPAAFSDARPMRVLFLGQINLRKGMAVVLETLKALENEPIEFLFVGPEKMEIADEFRQMPKVRWLGSVPRAEVVRHYREADIFLFSTFSDGFGLTQLEAQAWKLPIIASRFCGEVVQNGRNGIILEKITMSSLCEALLGCCRDPRRLAAFSQASVSLDAFSIQHLSGRLQKIVGESSPISAL